MGYSKCVCVCARCDAWQRVYESIPQNRALACVVLPDHHRRRTICEPHRFMHAFPRIRFMHNSHELVKKALPNPFILEFFCERWSDKRGAPKMPLRDVQLLIRRAPRRQATDPCECTPPTNCTSGGVAPPDESQRCALHGVPTASWSRTACSSATLWFSSVAFKECPRPSPQATLPPPTTGVPL